MNLNQNFANDDHALTTGYVIGTLIKAGIPAYPGVDDDGNYTPQIILRLPMGAAEPTDVILEVRP